MPPTIPETMPTTRPSTYEMLEFVRKEYEKDLTPADPRDRLVMCLRAEVIALDNALREEIERRKQLELGLRNWRLARETLEALDAGAREL